MTGVLVYAIALGQGDLHGPGLGISRRIIDCELVDERVGVETPETFDEPHVRAGSSEGRLIREIRRLDDQPVAVPMTNRVSIPQADGLWKMRTSVDGNDADFMTHLDPKRDVVCALNNLSIVVIGRGSYRRVRALQLETAFG